MKNITNSIRIPLIPPGLETRLHFRRLSAKELAWGEMLWKAHIAQEFRRSYEKLCALARQHVRTNHSAQDLVADLFAESLKWPLYQRRKIRNLGAYLREAVRNRSINAAKRKRSFAELDFNQWSDNISSENDMNNLEYDLDLETLLRCIATRQAEAFRLYFAGYSHEEISIAMELDSVGASKNLVYRAKLKMKELFLLWTSPDPDDDDGGSKVRTHRDPTVQYYGNTIDVSEPSFEDILMFVEGALTDRTHRQTVLKWILYGDNSMDIVSGLQKTIRHCHNRNIRLYFSIIKSAFEEQLFDPLNAGVLWNSDLPEPSISYYTPAAFTINNMLYSRKHNSRHPDQYIAIKPASPPTTASTTHCTFDTVRLYFSTLYSSTNLFSDI
jgi:DNA-directed RNA polymerase specialized sigma24 family protein